MSDSCKSPENITSGEPFTVYSEYITEEPGTKDELEILLAVKELEKDRVIYSEKQNLEQDKSQQVSFEDIVLEEITSPVYFELKLVADGKVVTSVANKEQASFLSNWKNNIITTYFPSEGQEGANNTWGEPLDEGNQFYFALPYRDFYYYVDGNDKEDRERKDYYGITDVKNRWIEIYYPEGDGGQGVYVYAQWRDVGPWNYYDPHYVFGDERPYTEIGIDMGWKGYYRETNKAGLDVSRKVIKYLIGQENDEEPEKGTIETNWRLVEEEDVPEGPWKEEISTGEADPEVLNLETETLRNAE
ncbi:MAG: hypothetical protein ACOCQ1_03135 [Halanaerobiaceae bacterium]